MRCGGEFFVIGSRDMGRTAATRKIRTIRRLPTGPVVGNVLTALAWSGSAPVKATSLVSSKATKSLPPMIKIGDAAKVPLTKNLLKMPLPLKSIAEAASVSVADAPYFDDDVLGIISAKYAAIPMAGPMPDIGDTVITTLIQTEKNAAPEFVFIENKTKKHWVDTNVFKTLAGEFSKTWRTNGLIVSKTDGDKLVRRLIANGVCHCTERRGPGNTTNTKVVAVSDSYVKKRITPAHILFFLQEMVPAGTEGRKLQTFGFVYARYERHTDAGTGVRKEYGLFIDIICSLTATTALLEYVVDFSKKIFNAQFVDLHSLAHVIPFYKNKGGFEFRKDCKSAPDYPEAGAADQIKAHYVDKKFPGCPSEVFNGSKDGKTHMPVYYVIRDLDAKDKGYVVASNPTCKAIDREKPGDYEHCMNDGIHMTRCLQVEAAAGAGNARRGGRRTRRASRRRNRRTRRA
jgi:hypothetical protein